MRSGLLFRIAFLCIFLTGIVLSSQHVFADNPNSRIHPYLQQLLNSANSDEMIPVYVMLGDRLSLEYLQSRTQGLNKKERRREVVRILKEHAASTQRDVLAYLESAKAQGLIDRVENIWSINVIAFKAKPAAIYPLAQDYAEIEQIRFDRPISREEAVDDNGISKYNEENHIKLAPTFSPQPGLILINAPAVWAEGDSGQGVVAANVDGGTDWRHPDLIHNIWNNLGEDLNGNGVTIIQSGSSWVFDPGDINGVDDDGNGKVDDFVGWNFSNNTNDPSTSSISHGTETAGIIVGDGTNGTQTGVAPRAKLMNLNINTAGESGWWAAYQYAFENGADVTTSSFSAKWGFSPQPNYPMFRQTNDMELAAGVLHTNSTSNDGNSYGAPFNISAPGDSPGPWVHPDQILVGGISSVVGSADVDAFTDIIASTSPYGPWAWEDYQINHPSYPYTMPPEYQDYPYETQPGSMGLLKPDVAAPGESTISTVPGGGYSGFGGTSGATPHLAGVAALLLGVNPDLEPADLSRIMQTTAVEKGAPGKDNRYGAGRVDAYAAYLQAFAEAGAPSEPSEFNAYSDHTIPNSMELNWNDPTNLVTGDTLLPGFFSVLIERDGTLIDSASGGTEFYLDTGLTDGVEYTYQIFAKVDSSGRTSSSVEATWIAGGSPTPMPPTNFGVHTNGNQVTAVWQNPSTNVDGTPMDDFAGLNLYQDGALFSVLNRPSADTAKADSVTFTPSSGGALNWYLSAFDDENPFNESAFTDTLVAPLNIPLLDAFTIAGLPNPVYWKNQNADINDRAVNMPSEPFALNFNGMPVGGDTVELYPIDLSNSQGSGIVFSYYYQPQGSGNAPEPGDSLQVFFKNDLGNWILVQGYPGEPLHDFQPEIIDIETAPNGGGTYMFSQFQIQIRSRGGANPTIPNDDWFMDNIYLGVPAPAIASSQDSVFFGTTLVGDTSSVEIQIHNVGVQSLAVSQVLGSGGIFSAEPDSFTVNMGSGQVVNVSFAPQAQGNYSGWIRFVSNDPVNDTLSVYVEGTGDQVTGIDEGTNIPKTFAVSPNYPNPFNPTTTIKYQLPQTSDVQLSIFNVLGQKVRTLVNAQIEAGYHSTEWDGRNDLGAQVGSGIYIYRFSAGDYLRVQKMIMLK